MRQRDVFLESEGDKWFQRNSSVREVADAPDVKFIIENLAPFSKGIENILEIGCSNATKLEYLCKSFDAYGFGVEPSKLAVQDAMSRGQDKIKKIQIGTAENLDFKDNVFELVIFGFCLYLQDRDTLKKAMKEADRVTKNGGFIVITDFDPGTKIINNYKHSIGVKSFKEDYGQYLRKSLFLFAKKSYSHASPHFEFDKDERVSTQIFFKENR